MSNLTKEITTVTLDDHKYFRITHGTYCCLNHQQSNSYRINNHIKISLVWSKSTKIQVLMQYFLMSFYGTESTFQKDTPTFVTNENKTLVKFT